MRRYWIDQSAINNDIVSLDGEEFHHIIKVCRQEVGSKFEVLTSEGKAYFVEITDLQKKQAKAKIIEQREIEPLPYPHIHICVSLPKFQSFELIIEKSVELGVKSIKPFFSDFSFVKDKSKVSDNKIKRWEKIVISATQQSGRGDLMAVEPLVQVEDLVSDFNSGFNQKQSSMGLFLYEGVCDVKLSDYLRAEYLKFEKNKDIKDIWVFVGSEGGFSEKEVHFFREQGFKSITLGSQILRVETACVALASVIKYEFVRG